jgi:hypothetical protein
MRVQMLDSPRTQQLLDTFQRGTSDTASYKISNGVFERKSSICFPLVYAVNVLEEFVDFIIRDPLRRDD